MAVFVEFEEDVTSDLLPDDGTTDSGAGSSSIAIKLLACLLLECSGLFLSCKGVISEKLVNQVHVCQDHTSAAIAL